MQVAHLIAVTVLISSLCSCGSLPEFYDSNSASTNSPSGPAPTVSDVVLKVQCELLDAIYIGQGKSPQQRPEVLGALTDKDKDLLKQFAAFKYQVSVSLTLDVTNVQGVAPSLSFIEPLHASGAKYTTGLSSNVNGTQHRQVSQFFSIDTSITTDSAPNETNKLETCKDKHQDRLKGDLKIMEAILSGMRQVKINDFLFKPYIANASAAEGLKVNPPGFGLTEDFTVVYGIGGGPNWTLTRFAGPGSLFNFNRTVKDTLQMTFAPALHPQAAGERTILGLTATPLESVSKANAARAAEDTSVRMLLQRLIPLQ